MNTSTATNPYTSFFANASSSPSNPYSESSRQRSPETATNQPIDVVIRAVGGDIGSHTAEMLSRIIALANTQTGAPQIRLWGLVRSSADLAKKLDGYVGAMAFRTNRGLVRNMDAFVTKGIDGHDGHSVQYFQRDGVVTAPIKLIGDISEIKNPGRVHGIDCSGQAKYKDIRKFWDKTGAERVIFSAPVKDFGKESVPFYAAHINTDNLEDAKVVSAASCTTNGTAAIVAPLIKNLPIKRWVEGNLVTIHEPTSSQKVLDTTIADAKKQQTMSTCFDTSTGAAKALKHVFKDQQDFFAKGFTAKATRHPGDGSQIDLELIVEAEDGKKITAEMVRNCFKGNPQYRQQLADEIKRTGGNVSSEFGKKMLAKRNMDLNKEVTLTDRNDINTRHILNTEVTAVVKSNSIIAKKLPIEGKNLYKIMISGYYDNVVGYAAQYTDLNVMYLNKFMGTKLSYLDNRSDFWNVQKA